MSGNVTLPRLLLRERVVILVAVAIMAANPPKPASQGPRLCQSWPFLPGLVEHDQGRAPPGPCFSIAEPPANPLDLAAAIATAPP